jgi:DNA-binding CsgD family transcriptional regulator
VHGQRTMAVVETAHAGEVAPLLGRAHGLSDRESQVCALLARGLPTSAIAARLHISPHACKTT